MDNNPNDFEDILLDVFVENHTNPSKDWVSLPLEELTKKQLENFKQKRAQASISEEDRRKEAITDGWYINSLLTLAHERYHLEKSEYLEFTANVAIAVVEHSTKHSDTPDSAKSCKQNCQIANLKELSPWEEEYLIYLATVFQSVFDLKRSMENGYYIPEEIQRKMGISLSYKRIGAWDQGRIKWQAAAQILWLDKGANVEKIKQYFLEPKLFNLLDLGMLPSTSNSSNSAEGTGIKYRALEDLIRKVNPGKPKRGRPLLRETGITDFAHYAVDPTQPLVQTLFLPLKEGMIPISRELFRSK